ncbi:MULTISPECIES: HNH endonuclease [Rhodobacterales]|uniref:HNH endonuclease n=1 Tax=Rhodobacterales TaxID=204455 RepID=UPI000897032A|nr:MULTISPECIES: HNH endonuclease signature motif containing protein [Paracoccaceae]SEB78447.1 HNH endonuclease [Rhodobacter sp. 24-YEA-8]
MTPTARKHPEWIGKTPDTAVPSWVKSRILDAQDGRCAECRNDFCAQLRPEFDHITALINLGENRESNLQALCGPCHGKKTAADVALKAKVARVRGNHLGLKPKSSRPVGGQNAKNFIIQPGGRVLHRDTREPVTRR